MSLRKLPDRVGTSFVTEPGGFLSTQQQRPTRSKPRIGWIAGWALTLVLAFVAGHYLGTRPAATTSPAQPAATMAPTPNAQVQELLSRLPRRQADDPLAKGATDAKVVLTQWSDFRCPYCARWAAETLPELEPQLANGTLRIEYRDNAVVSEQSVDTAIAARAAANQDKFWEFYATVFDASREGVPDHTPAQLMEYARTAGVPDLARFEADLSDPALHDAVARDTQGAQLLGITGTPFFVVGTTIISGAQPTSEFLAAIEQHAQ